MQPKKLVRAFFFMPFVMRIVCLLMLLSPFMALYSVLSGSVAALGDKELQYGAAGTIVEVIAVISFTLPSFLGGILIMGRVRAGVHLFIVGYAGATFGPLVLPAVRQSMNNLTATVLGTFGVGILVYFYLLFSRKVRQYFTEEGP